MPSNVRDEIDFPFPNFYGTAVEVGKWKTNFIPHLITDVMIIIQAGIKVNPN